MNKRVIFNPPNLVSMLRILLAPVLLTLAYLQYPDVFLITLIFTLLTDVLDGFLARHLNMITELGSHLDSWGDFIIYSTLAISAWWLWPEIIAEAFIPVAVIVLSFTLPVLIGLLKFRKLTSYHTWSVKIAVFITVCSYIIVFAGWVRWPLYMAAMACLIAAIEETLITLTLKHEHADIRSLWNAIQYERQNRKPDQLN